MPNYELEQKDFAIVLSILLAALAVRIAYFLDFAHTAVYNILPYSDSSYYFNWAKNIASGDILGGSHVFMKWPLYGYFLAACFKLLGDSPAIIYSLQFMLGALTAILIYFTAKIMFNRAAGLFAALFYLSYGMFLYYEGALIYAALSLFLNSLLFLYFLCFSKRDIRGGFLWAGIFSGVAALAQANILVFALPAAIWIAWQKYKRLAARFYGMLIFAAGLSIILGVSAVRNYVVEKDAVLVTGHLGINFYLGNNPGATGLFYHPEYIAPEQEGMMKDARIIAEQETGRRLRTSQVSDFWMKRAVNFIRNQPGDFLGLTFRKIAYLFIPAEPNHDTEYYLAAGRIRILKFLAHDLSFIMPFFILGMILCAGQFRKNMLLFLMVAALSLSTAAFFITTRYRIMLVSFMAIFAGFGVFSIIDAGLKKKYASVIKLGIGAVIISLVVGWLSGFRPRPDNYAFYRGFIQMGLLHEAKADYAGALAQYDQAAKLNPDGRILLVTLGSFYYDRQDYAAAEANFKKAIAVHPNFTDAYYDLGLFYNRQGRYKEARDILKKLVRLDPEDAAAHFELGRAYKNLGESELAGEEFTLALSQIGRWRKADIEMIQNER